MSETTDRKARRRRAAAAATPRAQDVTTAVLRTADQLRRGVAAALAPHGITSQQYNVLRILRGAHPHPLPTLEIAVDLPTLGRPTMATVGRDMAWR